MRIFNAVASFTAFIAGLSLCALVLVLGWQVFGRYVMNASPSWTEPVALTLMSVVALFGAALGVRAEKHFNFPTLVDSAPRAVHIALKSLARLIGIAFGLALAGFGAFLVVDAWDVPMAGAPMPEGVGYFGLTAGGALIALFAFERLIAGDPASEG
jgi:TRAP-type C4-dicarboxylate transport system permease small subunit